MAKKVKEEGGGGIMGGMGSRRRWSQLSQFLWPRESKLLQLRVVGCLLLLVITRGVTVLVPMIYKWLINCLTKTEQSHGEIPPRWDVIVLYIVMKSLYGGNGYLNVLRNFLWVPVAQSSHTRLRVQLFKHILNLSLRWHLQRKTGEVLRVVDRGVSCVDVILSEVVFSMLPASADIAIAMIFFTVSFDLITGLVIGLTMIGYVGCAMLLSKWKAEFRKEKNNADNQRQAAIVDAILNFETVKYHSAEDWEVTRYAEMLDRQMEAEWKVSVSADMRNVTRRTMMSLGLAVGSLLCAYYVGSGRFTVGDYVLFVSYIEQVYIPLNSFGDYYKRVQQAFIDMENMFEILEERPDVVDVPTAKPLAITTGRIEFKDVGFHYVPERPILRGINCCVEPGQTLALVGPSGAGKSTVLRLLLRFYDVTSGQILIDGQDVRDVRQSSLRENIGVVPQDTVLFNRDIEYNISYGKPTATVKEIHEAAQSADIHRRIVSFPDGYMTKVGERGLKLSGGEKQRVAIARTILKGAKIILLDEATSSLDTKTERTIQAAIRRACFGKTTIIVAHRLSTIVHADRILVIDDGQVVEAGTHDELIAIGPSGKYAGMWAEQLRQKKQSESTMPETTEDEEGDGEGGGGEYEGGDDVMEEEGEEENGEEAEGDAGTSVRKRLLNKQISEHGVRYIPKY